MVDHFILLHIEAFFLAASSQQRYLQFSISIRSLQKCCLSGLTCHKEDSVLASRQHISTASACKTYFERWSSAPPKTFLHFIPISNSTNYSLATIYIHCYLISLSRLKLYSLANRSVLNRGGQNSAHIEMLKILLQTFFLIFFPNIDHYIDCGMSLEKLLIEKELRFKISWKPSYIALAFTFCPTIAWDLCFWQMIILQNP